MIEFNIEMRDIYTKEFHDEFKIYAITRPCHIFEIFKAPNQPVFVSFCKDLGNPFYGFSAHGYAEVKIKEGDVCGTIYNIEIPKVEKEIIKIILYKMCEEHLRSDPSYMEMEDWDLKWTKWTDTLKSVWDKYIDSEKYDFYFGSDSKLCEK